MNQEFYSECCEAIRHYSNAISNLRTVTIAQGLGVLWGQATLMQEQPGNKALHLVVAVLGILLALILFALQWNYKYHFDALLENTIAIEKRLAPDQIGPWQSYQIAKGSDPRRRNVRLATLFGMYFLLGLSEAIFYIIALVCI